MSPIEYLQTAFSLVFNRHENLVLHVFQTLQLYLLQADITINRHINYMLKESDFHICSLSFRNRLVPLQT